MADQGLQLILKKELLGLSYITLTGSKHSSTWRTPSPPRRTKKFVAFSGWCQTFATVETWTSGLALTSRGSCAASARRTSTWCALLAASAQWRWIEPRQTEQKLIKKYWSESLSNNNSFCVCKILVLIISFHFPLIVLNDVPLCWNMHLIISYSLVCTLACSKLKLLLRIKRDTRLSTVGINVMATIVVFF